MMERALTTKRRLQSLMNSGRCSPPGLKRWSAETTESDWSLAGRAVMISVYLLPLRFCTRMSAASRTRGASSGSSQPPPSELISERVTSIDFP